MVRSTPQVIGSGTASWKSAACFSDLTEKDNIAEENVSGSSTPSSAVRHSRAGFMTPSKDPVGIAGPKRVSLFRPGQGGEEAATAAWE